MAFSKNRRLADLITANAEQFITSAHVTDAAIVPGDLHATLDLTGKTITVANASTGDSDTTVANTAFVQQEIAALVDSSPSALNTLNELAAALGDDASFSTTVTNSIATKAPLASPTFTGTLTSTNLTIADGIQEFDKPGVKGFRFLHNDAGNDLSIQQGDTNNANYVTKFNISTDGKIGLGTTSPTESIHINNTGSTAAFIRFQNTGGSGVYIGGRSEVMEMYTNGTERIRIGSSGNVGIGTTAVGNALTVSDATNISMSAGGAGQLRIEGAGYSGAIALDGNAMHIYQNSSGRDIVMGNNETEQFRITAAGNISTNALSAVTTAGGGIWYDAVNKYLSISHWASVARPTPAAMLHLTDNSNDLDVPQIRIEGRENPGDTKLDISVKDAGARINLIEGTGDANVGYGLMEFKTNSAANTTYPRRGGFKFDVDSTTPVEILNTGTLQLHGNSADWSETNPGHAKGSIHLDPGSNTNNFGNAITFGASDHNNGESTTAGIYLRSDGNYGSYMYLATSDSYASGAKMAMKINHSGHIHAVRGYITSQVPAFNAYYNGNSFAPGGNYIFAANATRFNNGGNYDTSNYRFTAPVDGVYRFYFRTITNGSASNQHLVFRKNGSDISGTNQHFSPNSGSAWCQLEMATLLDLSDGDWIDVRFVTLNLSIHGNAWNEFSGHLIG